MSFNMNNDVFPACLWLLILKVVVICVLCTRTCVNWLWYYIQSQTRKPRRQRWRRRRLRKMNETMEKAKTISWTRRVCVCVCVCVCVVNVDSLLRLMFCASRACYKATRKQKVFCPWELKSRCMYLIPVDLSVRLFYDSSIQTHKY